VLLTCQTASGLRLLAANSLGLRELFALLGDPSTPDATVAALLALLDRLLAPLTHASLASGANLEFEDVEARISEGQAAGRRAKWRDVSSTPHTSSPLNRGAFRIRALKFELKTGSHAFL